MKKRDRPAGEAALLERIEKLERAAYKSERHWDCLIESIQEGRSGTVFDELVTLRALEKGSYADGLQKRQIDSFRREIIKFLELHLGVTVKEIESRYPEFDKVEEP